MTNTPEDKTVAKAAPNAAEVPSASPSAYAAADDNKCHCAKMYMGSLGNARTEHS